jgi:O-antigen/teichoic acid export membrane protein
MKEKVFSNLIWRFAERTGAQVISFIVTIILARILEPEVYGNVALITVFTSIMQVFVDGGMGNALIQKKDADDTDFSTVFYFNIVFCSVVYILIFVCAPHLASFYEDQTLTNMIRVASVIILISGMKNIQQAYVSRTLQFRTFFFATLIGTIVSAVVGISMAYAGFGAWALIGQKFTNAFIDTIALWIIVKWRPKMLFSVRRMYKLFTYGWKLLVSSLIDTLYGNVRQLIIGKLYSASDLAYYNRGRYIPNLVVTNINTSIDSVLFPIMSKSQDDINGVRNMMRRAIKTSNYIMAPMMIGIACMAEPIVTVLLTDKWLPSVPYLRIFCIIYMFQPIHTANANAIKALGRSDISLKLELITKIVGVSILLISMNFGVIAIAISYLINNFINQIINSWPNRKLLNYRYLEQIHDILPNTMLAMFMGGCVYAISYLQMPVIISMILQVVSGIVIYILGSIIFKIDSFDYILETIKKKVRGNM